MSKKSIPPLTVEWLENRSACHGGLLRFKLAAPSGSLVMDRVGEMALRKHCEASDLWWLLKRIIGVAEEGEVYGLVSKRLESVNGHSNRMAGHRVAYAAACVAAWREYHK